jgi:hypothetical protein
MIASLLIAIPKAVQWSGSRGNGPRLKGPELVSVRQFNRRTHRQHQDDSDVTSTVQAVARQRAFAIPRAIESSHLLIMGNSDR